MTHHHIIDDLTPDQSVTAAVQMMVTTRFKDMWKHRKETATGDVEALHDMRVGSRRLRAALNLAKPTVHGKEFARFCRLTQQLTNELGRARDDDVMLHTLDDLAKMGGADAPTVVRSLTELVAAERLVKRKRLLEFFDELDACGYAESAERLWREK